MQIVTGRRGEPHVTSRQMQAVYRSFLGDFALLDIGEKLRAEAYSDDIVRVYDGVVSVQGIYAVIAYNQYDEVYIEPVSVGKKRIDTIVLHYTKDSTLDVEDMQLDVVQGEEYTDNPIAPVVPEGGDAWEGTTDIQVPIYDVEVTNFGLTVTPHTRMLTVIPTLDSIAERIPETVVTGVKGDSEVLYRDGDVNITKANIGLGNVDNTADTDKPISTATQTALNLKADLTYVDAKISAAYHAGGSKTVAELTSALLIADNIGKVYNMSDSGVTTSDFVEGAGEPINKGDNVDICNVGTEESPVYKFDLLSGFVDLSAYATTSAVNAGLADKVDKVEGKGLSTEDYTTIDKTKLAGISEGATQTVANPADTATETLSKLEVGGVVYDVPQGASGATELSELTDVNLTDVEDNDILQYDETANKWKNSNALQGAKTTTGNPITVTDCAPVNAVNVSVDLEPIQDLHGYDHPWAGGAGKNLLKMTLTNLKSFNTTGTWNENTYTYNGIAYTPVLDSDGNVTGIKANGTTSDVSAFVLDSELSASENCILTGGKSANMLINARFTTQPFDWNSDNGSGTTLDMTRPRFIFIYISANSTLNNEIFKPMARLQSITDPTFEPYTNKCGISGRDEVAIQRVGKNLVPMTVEGIKSANTDGTWNGNVYTQHNGVVFTVNTNGSGNVLNIHVEGTPSYGSGWLSLYKDLLDIGGIILSGCPEGGNINSYTLSAFKSNPNIWYPDYGNGVTIPQDVILEQIYIEIKTGFSIPSGGLDFYPMIRLASDTDSTYEPYAGKTYTIQIGQTVYGGQLDVTRGKMVVDRGYAEFDGSSDENWVNAWTGTRVYCADGIRIPNGKVESPSAIGISAISDKYDWTTFDYQSSSMWAIRVDDAVPTAFAIRNDGELFIKDINYSSASALATYLASNPLQVVYKLATPYTIQLTPQQIKLLENTNTLYTDYEGDTITLEYQPNNAIGEAVRIVEESYDPEFAVRPPLKKIAFSGTTDSDGSVTLINASDIPSNHRIIPLHITDMTIDGNAGTYFVEYEPYNSGDAVKGYCYFYMSGSQMFPVGKAITGNFYYYELEG